MAIRPLIAIVLAFFSFPLQALAGNCEEKDTLAQAICLHGNRQYKEALRMLEADALAGNTGAQLTLSDMYFAGEGTSVNFRRAIYWAERAFNEGARGAAMRLAGFYSIKDDETSRKKHLAWLAVASQEENTTAMVLLGDLYASPGPENDPCLANYWYSHALLISSRITTIDKIHPDVIASVIDKASQAKSKCAYEEKKARNGNKGPG